MERWAAKTLALVLLLVVTLVLGLVPIKLVQFSSTTGVTGQRIIQFLTCISGGVFLGTFLLHLLPELEEQFHRAIQDHADDYPWGQLGTACGFFFILVLEQVFIYLDNKQAQKYVRIREEASDKKVETSDDETKNKKSEQTGKEYGSILAKHEVETDGDSTKKFTKVTLFIIALSAHSVFEGLALGLQMSIVQIWTIFTAIVTHKSIISFSLGLELIKTFNITTRCMIVSITIFAVASPLGVAIGTIIVEVTKNDTTGLDLTIAVLQSIAAGTFMYITFFEILVKIFQDNTFPILKVFFVIVGFAIMVGLRTIHNHSLGVSNTDMNSTTHL